MSKDLDNKKELAKILYMSGKNQKDISDQIKVSRVTINKWVNQEGWKEIRAAKTITRPELINKMLLSINNMIDEALKNPAGGDLTGMSDKLSKIAAAIEKLDKKTNVVNVIEAFIGFEKWLEQRASYDKSISTDLIKEITSLQDRYINEQFNTQSK